MMVLTHFTVLGCHFQWKESSWSQDLWIQIPKSLLRRVSGSIGIAVLFVIFEYIWTLPNIWERLKGGQHSLVFSCNEPWKILGLGSKSQSTETPFPTAACLMMTHSWKGSHKFPGSITPSSSDPSTPGLKPLHLHQYEWCKSMNHIITHRSTVSGWAKPPPLPFLEVSRLLLWGDLSHTLNFIGKWNVLCSHLNHSMPFEPPRHPTWPPAASPEGFGFPAGPISIPKPAPAHSKGMSHRLRCPRAGIWIKLQIATD